MKKICSCYLICRKLMKFNLEKCILFPIHLVLIYYIHTIIWKNNIWTSKIKKWFKTRVLKIFYVQTWIIIIILKKYLKSINSPDTTQISSPKYISFFKQIMLNIQYTTLFGSRGWKGELSFILGYYRL